MNEQGVPPGSSARADDDVDENEKIESLSPLDVVESIAKGGEQMIIDWYNAVTHDPPRFDAFLEDCNKTKNRFPNVILYDHSRVRLKGKPEESYYHASYVDTYDQVDGFILAQAPFDEATEADFWRLAYQTNLKMIVLLSDLDNHAGVRLLKQFWPLQKMNREYASTGTRIACLSTENSRDCDIHEIMILGPGQRGQTGAKVLLLHYRKWLEDKDVPDNLVDFRALVKIWGARAGKDGKPGPTCLMCPTGVHRAGTFAALDILLDRLAAERKVGLVETVKIIRDQRYGCLAYFDHYAYLNDTILRHAITSGLVDAGALAKVK